MTAKHTRALRAGGAFVTGDMLPVATLRNPGAIDRAVYAKD